MNEIRTAMIIGAGTMGHGFSQVFAMNDIRVILVDTNEDLLKRARGWIDDNLSYMVELGELEASRPPGILDKINFTSDLGSFAADADFVLEAVNEDLALKLEIFKKLDAATSSTAILASNTSSYDINEICSVCAYKQRVIGTHWFHPPQITPCVEVIPAEPTSRQTIDSTLAFLERIGKVPTLCKSSPGFVANRIQMAMAAEALAMVEEGLATPAEIDRIVKTSFGFRLGAYGPFEVMDQAGTDTYLAVYKYLYEKFRKSHFKPSPVLEKLVGDKKIGLKTNTGFYEYGEGAVDALKRDRDRKFYGRLRLFREEQGSKKGK